MKTWIIVWSKQYFSGFGPHNKDKWSPKAEDAFRFESEKAAKRLARQIGGEVTT